MPIFHFWFNTFFIKKNLSSELTKGSGTVFHRNKKNPNLNGLESIAIPWIHTYSKTLVSFNRMDNHFAPISLPDLKADLSEENLLALASSSCNSSDDLGLKRDDDASKLSDFSAALEKSKLTKHLMTTATGSRRISDFTIRSREGALSPIR